MPNMPPFVAATSKVPDPLLNPVVMPVPGFSRYLLLLFLSMPSLLAGQALLTGPQTGVLWFPAADTTGDPRTYPGVGFGLRYLTGNLPASAGLSVDFFGRRTGPFDRQQYLMFSAYGDYFLREKGLRPYLGARLGGWLAYRTRSGLPLTTWYLGLMPRVGIMPAASHNAFFDLWVGYGFGLPEAEAFQVMQVGLTLWYQPAY